MGSIPIEAASERYTPVIRQLLFPNANLGVALGQAAKIDTASPLFLTRDGGRRWTRYVISPDTEIQQIATTSSYLYAVTEKCADKVCTPWRLERTSLSTLRWTSLPMPHLIAKYDSGLGITAYGSEVWLNTMDQTSKPYPSYLAISNNLGASFRVSVQPILTSLSACGLEAMSREILWATCGDGMMAGQIPYSNDGGLHWILKGTTSILEGFQWGAFDPVSATVGFAVDGNFPDRLYSVTNGLVPPKVVGAVLKNRFPNTLCFVNARDGVVLVEGIGAQPSASVWYTGDGGAQWRRVLQ
jgi:hypothetical protein